MRALPITELTLYKHGVGFFRRQGPAQDGSVTLQFRPEEMNDVLKSLTVLTQGGGQVLGLDYESPEDRKALLARSSIHLSQEAALRDLLRDLRGRDVEITTPAGTVLGTMVGIDRPDEREAMAATPVSVLKDGGEVTSIALGEILALEIRDSTALDDLKYVLGASLTDQGKRAVTVRLTKDAPAALVSYIAPSPTWRVSYRLVVEPNGDATSALVQGWGHFDNTLDEDLEGVKVRLVAGMPISFVYDLYAPFTPERPVVQEENRTVAGPVEFEAPSDAKAAEPAQAEGALRTVAGAPGGVAYSIALGAPELASSTIIGASGQATGDAYSYAVSTPVTVRRGNAAIVPILQFTPEIRKERIYNRAKHPGNPVITARFRNDTSLTLERGPITVLEAGEYAGEAMFPFTQAGGEVYLPYAVDLGVRVAEEPNYEHLCARVSLKEGYLLIEEHLTQSVTYRLENRGDEPVRVLIEERPLPNYAPYDTPEPTETTLTSYRYAVEIAAHATASLATHQRQVISRNEAIRNQKMAQLRQWLADKVLDEAAFQRLRHLLSLYGQIDEHQANIRSNEKRRSAVREEQKVIQGNLGALRTDGEEGELRARYARTLAEMEDLIGALATDDETHRQETERLKAEIEAELASL